MKRRVPSRTEHCPYKLHFELIHDNYRFIFDLLVDLHLLFKMTSQISLPWKHTDLRQMGVQQLSPPHPDPTLPPVMQTGDCLWGHCLHLTLGPSSTCVGSLWRKRRILDPIPEFLQGVHWSPGTLSSSDSPGAQAEFTGAQSLQLGPSSESITCVPSSGLSE